ncbi:hypothetical protein PAPYR_2859 [Paratrimastix pyriformis]|uniref:Uncharacterized protein n=1 Tax=Paratrimastix pyriformis TaxID=342808 RepID=A0ABQ8URN6_9EUKA|nr:hypothetical protein PAPYR_2859 [Paratrimastix pyriformis]
MSEPFPAARRRRLDLASRDRKAYVAIGDFRNDQLEVIRGQLLIASSPGAESTDTIHVHTFDGQTGLIPRHFVHEVPEPDDSTHVRRFEDSEMSATPESRHSDLISLLMLWCISSNVNPSSSSNSPAPPPTPNRPTVSSGANLPAAPADPQHARIPPGTLPLSRIPAELANPDLVSDPGAASELFRTVALACQNFHSRAVLARDGVAPTLVRLLQAPGIVAHPAALQQLLRAVANFATSESRSLMQQPNAVSTLMNLLATRFEPSPATITPATATPALSASTTPGPIDILRQLLRVLANITSGNRDAQLALSRAGAAGPFLHLFHYPWAISALSSELVQAAHNMIAHCAECRLAFGRAGAPKALGRLLDNLVEHLGPNPDESDVLRRSLRLLSELIAKEAAPNRALFEQAGVAIPLVRLLTTRPLTASSPHAKYLLHALSNLGCEDGTRRELDQAGVAVPLVRLLADAGLTHHPVLTPLLFKSLCNLSCSAEGAEHFGRAGVIAPLGDLLADPEVAGNPDVAGPLLAALGNLITDSPVNRAAVRRAGLLESLERLVQDPPSSEVGMRALAALQSLQVTVVPRLGLGFLDEGEGEDEDEERR